MADTSDPASHTIPAPTGPDPKRALAASAQLVQVAITVLAFVAVTAGAIMVVVGKIDQDGGYFDDSFTYELRTPGAIILALGLLVGPISWLVAKAVEVWAKS